MPQTRKRRSKKAETKPKGSHGGVRPGAGRKPTLVGSRERVVIAIRCSPEVKGALQEFVEALSADRAEKGLSKVDLSTWMRELALKHSGNDHLSLAAQARRQAEEAESIV